MTNQLADRFRAGTLPHAILLIGSVAEATALVDGLIEELAINPADFRLFNSTEPAEPIKIIDARAIKNFMQMSRFTSPIKLVFIADATTLTPEAANALLKTLEEPPEGSHMILATTKAESLLATIRSRCQVIRLGTVTAESGAELESGVPALEKRDLASAFQIAKELASSDVSLPTIFSQWSHQLASQPTDPKSLLWQRLVLDYMDPAQTSVNRRLLLDNFFLDIYNTD